MNLTYNKKTQSGFTLIEVITVVAIIGMLAAIATPVISAWLPNIRLKGAARDLYSNIQKTRMAAIKNNESMGIVFDTVNNNYNICSSPGSDNVWSTLSDNITDQQINLTQYNSGTAYGSGGIGGSNSVTKELFPADNVSYNNNVMVLNSQGTGSAGYVYLQNDNNTVIAIGTQASGVVLLRKYVGGGKWE